MSDDTPWLAPEQLHAWMHVSAALTTLPAAIECQLKRDSGLNWFEYSVLASLAETPGHAKKLCELAVISHGSQSRLSHAISRMERSGWVERRSCMEGSARSVEAVLTPAGLAKIVEAAPGHVVNARKLVVDALSPEEFDQLHQVLRKILLAAAPEMIELIDTSFAERNSALPGGAEGRASIGADSGAGDGAEGLRTPVVTGD
ncbi:MarR family winged helix-turn-helix transcriptional regulator [Kineosporia succinea]|uniref:DNA-binding MarR family transcriptional regulator n=1 Tax=Kineosporia succinea TaxID=84632 RepID=A0ABT9PB80_9ACTN|nr:MarR family winged helix-turn-helix transcriptional regulator [Kineosporia succinea]MDP9829957.1 DNA-binding MarR family transcriptional regulator [Kineosporia succinea]